MIYICIIILVILIFIILLFYRVKEGFADSNPNMLGYEEGNPNEYRKITYKNLEPYRRNRKEFIANNWDLRFPYMVNPRYSYDDKPDGLSDYYNYQGAARLKELPLNLDVDTNYIDLTPFPNMDPRTCKYDQNPQDLRNEYINSNSFIYTKDPYKQVNGFDYDNSQRITFNSASGTSDSYYLEDKGF